MTIRVVFLGRLRDVAGSPETFLSSEGDQLDWICFLESLRLQANDEIAMAAGDPTTKVALNGVLQRDKLGLVFRPDDEVALLPPVSGG